jgi:hypothetical protein
MKTLYMCLMLGLMVGCASEPMMQSGPEAEVSFDGLTRVDNTTMRNVWVKSDLDLSPYTKIKLVGAGIDYRSVKPASRSARVNAGRSEFPLDANQKSRLEAMVGEVFLEELAKNSYFEIVTEEGPDVLNLTGALLDVVSNVPPAPTGRGGVYLSEFGAATLVTELRDSQSGEIFVRSIDRQNAESAFMQEATRGMNMSEVKMAVRHWARVLTSGLDKIHDIEL